MSDAFVMPFHNSDHPGPDDPKNIMFRTYPSNWEIRLIVLYGIVGLGLLGAVALNVLPVVLNSSTTPVSPDNWELALMILVLCSGALGGLVHLYSSLAAYIGERRLERSWLLFYYLRPPVGAALAIIVYFVLRVGVLSPSQLQGSGAEAVNVYGVLTFAALAGMFARQAVDKLAEVVEILFKKAKEDLSERSATQMLRGSARDDLMARLTPVTAPAGPAFDEVEEVVDRH